MGYYIQFLNAEIFISAQDIDSVHKALIDLANQSKRIAFVDTEVLRRSENLEDALEEWLWNAEIDEEGNLVNLYRWEQEKLGAEEILFQTMAPWVKDGSYILVRGEDGEVWRWFFEGGSCREQHGTIVFYDVDF